MHTRSQDRNLFKRADTRKILNRIGQERLEIVAIRFDEAPHTVCDSRTHTHAHTHTSRKLKMTVHLDAVEKNFSKFISFAASVSPYIFREITIFSPRNRSHQTTRQRYISTCAMVIVDEIIQLISTVRFLFMK